MAAVFVATSICIISASCFLCLAAYEIKSNSFNIPKCRNKPKLYEKKIEKVADGRKKPDTNTEIKEKVPPKSTDNTGPISTQSSHTEIPTLERPMPEETSEPMQLPSATENPIPQQIPGPMQRPVPGQMPGSMQRLAPRQTSGSSQMLKDASGSTSSESSQSRIPSLQSVQSSEESIKATKIDKLEAAPRRGQKHELKSEQTAIERSDQIDRFELQVSQKLSNLEILIPVKSNTVKRLSIEQTYIPKKKEILFATLSPITIRKKSSSILNPQRSSVEWFRKFSVEKPIKFTEPNTKEHIVIEQTYIPKKKEMQFFTAGCNTNKHFLPNLNHQATTKKKLKWDSSTLNEDELPMRAGADNSNKIILEEAYIPTKKQMMLFTTASLSTLESPSFLSNVEDAKKIPEEEKKEDSALTQGTDCTEQNIALTRTYIPQEKEILLSSQCAMNESPTDENRSSFNEPDYHKLMEMETKKVKEVKNYSKKNRHLFKQIHIGMTYVPKTKEVIMDSFVSDRRKNSNRG